MRTMKSSAFVPAALLLMAALPSLQGLAQNDPGGRASAVVTVLSKHSEVAPNVTQQQVSAKVNGKDAAVTSWTPFKSAGDSLELVVMIDGGARNLGRQFEEIKEFVQKTDPQTKIAIAYMENGRAAFAGPLTSDRQQVIAQLHLPAGPSSNPYFSLSDVAQRWPSQDRAARREVVILTDGIDPNNRRFDADDPYVQSAIKDTVSAGLVVYAIYWHSGFTGGENSPEANGGQSLISQVTQATGGNSYWLGTDNPVSFQPFFEDLSRRFAHQYELRLSSRPERKAAVESLKMKAEGLSLQITAPQLIFVTP